ncbi:hypothetical protein ACRE_083860 [Hapsidospora chrysogenum ATCC 11550]|uniref:Uncharacterized protein n=1 Tax=Hapsidospora chrysogenum (strain ATCC 11550 / CBS 779.69 / DSM 880 / IAM 14645 / JCM 23072 / IMI 49137) TaxID=857340 RepID=A0A086SUX1_HAPC1|nr:hypothetical protein ACRE_083860 [Hapsidospora chrysogenum ATCC 11550]
MSSSRQQDSAEGSRGCIRGRIHVARLLRVTRRLTFVAFSTTSGMGARPSSAGEDRASGRN